MFDQGKGFTHAQQQPMTAVIRNVPPRRIRWGQLAPYLAAVAGVAIAVAALMLSLMWKGSAEAQISQLQTELATVQSQAATTSSGLAGLSGRVRGLSGTVTGMSGTVTGMANFNLQCQLLQNSPSGPASYLTPCRRTG